MEEDEGMAQWNIILLSEHERNDYILIVWIGRGMVQ
jgi:hypothetical protein